MYLSFLSPVVVELRAYETIVNWLRQLSMVFIQRQFSLDTRVKEA